MGYTVFNGTMGGHPSSSLAPILYSTDGNDLTTTAKAKFALFRRRHHVANRKQKRTECIDIPP